MLNSVVNKYNDGKSKWMEAFDNINETWVEPLKKGIEKLKDDWKVAINKTKHLK